jgi:hypothetical protein
MKSWFDFRFYLILALIGISSYLTFRLSKIENSIVERVTVDTLYVTKDTTIFKNGKTIFRTKVDTVEIPVYIDTTGVIKDYYTKYVYSDTLNFNEHGSIVLKDTITQNSIQNRLIDANLSTVYITKEITKTQTPKVEYYIGGGVGLGGQNFLNNMTSSILVRSKKRTLYGIEGGLTTSPLENTIKPYFGIKYYTPFR